MVKMVIVLPRLGEFILNNQNTAGDELQSAGENYQSEEKDFAAVTSEIPSIEENPSDMMNKHTTDFTLDQNQNESKSSLNVGELLNTHRKLVIKLLIGLLIVIAICVGAKIFYDNKVDYKSDFNAPKVFIQIPQGSTGADIGNILFQHNVIASTAFFKQALKSSDNANVLTYGNFNLPQHLSSHDAIDLLANSDSKAVIEVTIPEGYTVFEICDKISQDIANSEVMKETNPKTVNDIHKEIVTALKSNRNLLPSQANSSYEGWLYPAKYDFEEYSPKAIIDTMIKKTVSVLKNAKIPESQWQETLIKASIVQEEVSKIEDMKKVATVINNRLENDMQLGLDSTIAFGISKGKKTYGLELKQSDLENADNLYNTRIHLGLPPTPISSPGSDAIDAIKTPIAGNWLYYCTVDPETGETEFSESEADFENSVAKYKTWLQAHPEYNK